MQDDFRTFPLKYVVKASGGTYDERAEWVLAAYIDPEKAKEHKDKYNLTVNHDNEDWDAKVEILDVIE